MGWEAKGDAACFRVIFRDFLVSKDFLKLKIRPFVGAAWRRVISRDFSWRTIWQTEKDHDGLWKGPFLYRSDRRPLQLKNVESEQWYFGNLLLTIDIKYHVGGSVGFKASTKKMIILGYINSTLQTWVAWEYKYVLHSLSWSLSRISGFWGTHYFFSKSNYLRSLV